MLFSLLLLCSVDFVIVLSNYEDLSITKYSHVGCLDLKPDKQFIVNNIQENYLLPYQTFVSSHMTHDLCFRLCRQWTILLFNYHTHCICLYTINKPYEFNEYLGEYLSINNCTLNDTQVYSLTKDNDALPPLLSSKSDDWSFDGCYYIEGIQAINPDKAFTDLDFAEAIDSCRNYCRQNRTTDDYSYFLSSQKSCYCLPIRFFEATERIALRRPVIDCSFLPTICQGYSGPCEKYYSETSVDALIKINVHHYCLSTNFTSFVFDRMFYLCLQTISFKPQTTFSTRNHDQKCLPIVIKTSEQWNYLTRSSWINESKLFISISRNSTYIFNDLFKLSHPTQLSNDLCVSIMRTASKGISYNLTQCSQARSSDQILCAQKPFLSKSPRDKDFAIRSNKSDSFMDAFSCPPKFILFNKMCYYIHSSLADDIQKSEDICRNQYSNSTLVKFDSHERGNTNAARTLGRTLNDILLEFFSYSLEISYSLENTSVDLKPSRPKSLQFLLGDKNNPDQCILRSFTRSLDKSTPSRQCQPGGHPVCHAEPIQENIPKTIPTNQPISIINNSVIQSTTKQTTTQFITSKSTTFSTRTKQVVTSVCKNCTVNPPVADEDLVTNKTKIDPELSNNATSEHSKKTYLNSRPLILILSGPVLGLILLFAGIGLLIWYLRQNRGLNSTQNSIGGGRRTKRSSTTVTTEDVPNTPAILYTPLKRPRFSSAETSMLLPLDNLLMDDDQIELLPTVTIQATGHGNKTQGDDEEPWYAIPTVTMQVASHENKTQADDEEPWYATLK